MGIYLNPGNAGFKRSLNSEIYIDEVWIPNSEVQKEFINVLEDGGWEKILEPIQRTHQCKIEWVEK